ncbi:hypothetical protein D3C80_1476720 [compost metagenome]
MGTKTDDIVTVCQLAQSTSCAGYAVALFSRASYHFVTRWAGLNVRCINRQDSYNWCNVQSFQFVSVVQVVARQVDCEAHCVCLTDGNRVAFVHWVVVGVGETFTTSVCLNQFTNFAMIQHTVIQRATRQITSLIMTPQATLTDCPNLQQEAFPIGAPFTLGHRFPVDVRGTARSITTLYL